ncbi:MAG: hypothetical protein KDI88_15845 [Gammaproteobacteria bacterium]|nr:hypothetical protein [Gammaproteobacteria bacterium]
MPGALFWLAGLLLANRLVGMQRVQVLLMLAVGGIGLSYAAWAGGEPALASAFSNNQALLAMLAGVTFLRLISLPEVDAGEPDPRGRGALWRTLLGVHLFGSAINLSAVMILGDRQSRRAPMTPLQATVLSRGFALASHWSPFFAAMGIALGNAPGADWKTLSLAGLPLAAFGLLYSGWRLGRRPEVATFVGYPTHFSALWVPALLAAFVMAAHQALPAVPILTLISTGSVVLTALVLLLRQPATAGRRFVAHVTEGLPRMSGELVLFLAAGVLAAGISGLVTASGWRLDIPTFGATEASVVLLIMVGLSVLGVHPVISIATSSGILAPLSPDPNLMGVTYLMTWAAGVSISPFSGMHLAMQGRFNLNAFGFLRWNGGYNLVMLVVYVAWLHAFEIAG